MKKFKKTVCFALIMTFLCFVGCNQNCQQQSVPVDFSLNVEAIQLKVGDTFLLEVIGDNIISSDVVWSTEDTSVASVSDGLVIAVAPGNTNISATLRGVTAKCNITVIGSEETEITLNKSVIELEIGETQQLEVSDKAIDNSEIYWETGNERKATVSNTGLVTAVSTGRTVIIATYKEHSMYCIVNILPENTSVPIFIVDVSSLRLLKGTSADRVAKVSYNGEIVSCQVSYVSNDENIITVSNGVVLGLGVGKTTIDISANYKNILLTQTIEVEVTDFLILFDEYEITLTRDIGNIELSGKLWTVAEGLISDADFNFTLEDGADVNYITISGNTLSFVSKPDDNHLIKIRVKVTRNQVDYYDEITVKLA